MYVPFVFQQIGILSRKRFSSDLKEVELLWKVVDEGKKDAIQKLVEINFKRLREDLRVLLFDIVLFVIPIGHLKLSDATPILCGMHDMADIDAVKMEWKIKELMEHCALSITDDGELRVHDIYVEFARSTPGNSKSYVDEASLNCSDALVTNGQNCEPTVLPVRLYGKYADARTVYIGSRIKSPHAHVGVRALKLEIRLHVEVGATTRALLVRNSCPDTKCIFCLSGDFSSLVCLQTENNQQVAFSPSGCDIDVDFCKLQRLELKNQSIAQDMRARTWRGQKRKWTTYFLDLIGNQFEHTTQSMMSLLKPLIPYEQWSTGNDHLVRNFLLSGRMSQLRVLILINSGIRRLENIGTYCPRLEVLEVLDDAQYVMDVCVDNAPQLKRLVVGEKRFWSSATSGIYKFNSRNTRKLSLHLGECCEVQHIYVDASMHNVMVVGMLPSNLRHLEVANDRFLQFMPMKLISSSIHQLSMLATLNLICKTVETFDFHEATLRLPSFFKRDFSEELRQAHTSFHGARLHAEFGQIGSIFLCELGGRSGAAADIIDGELKYYDLFHLSQLQVERILLMES